MKTAVALLIALGAALVLLGSPLATPAHRADWFGAGRAVLPMTFAHADHRARSCLSCHHEFRDGDRSQTCLACHLTAPRVAAKLEAQFHALCRSCHEAERAAGRPAGPTRACAGCHLPDDAF